MIGIIGGGITGLTLASLVKDTVVLEKGSGLGGLARSIKERGYTFDQGSHIIFSGNNEVLSFFLSLLGKNVIKHKRNSKILYNGRLVKYPFENGLNELPAGERLRFATDYLLAPKKQGNVKNFKEWMYCRFGKSITEKYLYPYNVKIWDYPPEKMDTFWVEGRIPQPAMSDIVKSVFGMGSEGYKHQLDFYYPEKGGYGAVIDSLANKIEKHRISTGFEVDSVKKERDGWYVKSKKKEKFYKRIVSTIHVKDFIESYAGADSEVKNAAESLKWNSIHLVMFGLKRKKVNNIHWCYVPDEEVLTNRVSFPSNYSPFVAPKNHSSVLAEITFRPGGKKSKLKNEEIIQRTADELHGLKLIDKNDIVFTKIVTCPYAYVIYDLGYKQNISKIHDFAEREGVHLLGRFSEFRYMNADKCVEHAVAKSDFFNRF